MRVVCQRFRLKREVVVPVLVIGSLVVAVVAGVAAGVERPYPGYALGSGLLLVLERLVAIWAAALFVLVVGDQALRGRLPIEVSGRGVRYAEREQLDEAVGNAVEAGAAIADGVSELEAAFETLEQRLKTLEARS